MDEEAVNKATVGVDAEIYTWKSSGTREDEAIYAGTNTHDLGMIWQQIIQGPFEVHGGDVGIMGVFFEEIANTWQED